MKKKIKKIKKNNNTNMIINHIKETFNIYFLCGVLFILGITIGVIFVNGRTESQIENTKQYINESLDTLKNNSTNDTDYHSISKFKLFKYALKRNMIVLIIIWILGLTFIGKYILYILLLFYGITFGYTFSSILSVMSFTKGLLFILSSMVLQNLITIPAIIFLIVQGIKSYNLFSFNHTINKVTIRYTAYSIVIAILLIMSAFLESFISTDIIYKISKYL